MKQLRQLVHRTILVFDVEGFGDLRRSVLSQRAIREGMYSALQQALGDLGVSWQACEHEDRGDGLFVLVPPDTEKGLFAEAFPLKLAAALHAHNDTHKPEEAYRLRIALHAGEVQFDDHGVTAPALNHAFRLINATPFKSALKNSSGVLAIIASSWFYSEVIRNSEEYRPDTCRPERIDLFEIPIRIDDNEPHRGEPNCFHPTLAAKHELNDLIEHSDLRFARRNSVPMIEESGQPFPIRGAFNAWSQAWGWRGPVSMWQQKVDRRGHEFLDRFKCLYRVVPEIYGAEHTRKQMWCALLYPPQRGGYSRVTSPAIGVPPVHVIGAGATVETDADPDFLPGQDIDHGIGQ